MGYRPRSLYISAIVEITKICFLLVSDIQKLNKHLAEEKDFTLGSNRDKLSRWLAGEASSRDSPEKGFFFFLM